jgi:uncharacterized membrane protein YuzA (DUF378 family)
MKIFNVLGLLFVVIGALLWSLEGLTGADVVKSLFGATPIVSRIIYGVVALAGLYMLAFFRVMTETRRK